jgi:hypothetical protein
MILMGSNSVVRDLTVAMRGAASERGIVLDSTATIRRVGFTTPSAGADMAAIRANIPGATHTIDDVTIDLPTGGVTTYGLQLVYGAVTVTDSRITARRAIESAPQPTNAVTVLRVGAHGAHRREHDGRQRVDQLVGPAGARRRRDRLGRLQLAPRGHAPARA